METCLGYLACFDIVAASAKRRPPGRNGCSAFGSRTWARPWTSHAASADPFRRTYTPVFVLTHHPRAPLRMRGSTELRFVTDGIHAALQQARDAADGRDMGCRRLVWWPPNCRIELPGAPVAVPTVRYIPRGSKEPGFTHGWPAAAAPAQVVRRQVPTKGNQCRMERSATSRSQPLT
jgi:hypothetical protein